MWHELAWDEGRPQEGLGVALNICRGCPARAACEAEGMDRGRVTGKGGPALGEWHGVWGGRVPPELEQRAVAAAVAALLGWAV